jgi:hypothetical protein
MSTATEFREWATRTGTTMGSAIVDCKSIAEAEAYVRDFPACSHGFATCGKIAMPYTTWEDTGNRMLAAIKGAAYTYVGDGQFRRGDLIASATRNRTCGGYAAIWIKLDGSMEAWHCGANGYLPCNDQPMN